MAERKKKLAAKPADEPMATAAAPERPHDPRPDDVPAAEPEAEAPAPAPAPELTDAEIEANLKDPRFDPIGEERLRLARLLTARSRRWPAGQA